MSDLEVLSFTQNACSFLSEKYYYESGLLFQTPPSHNAVRSLIDRCLKESMRVLREESNAHIIAGSILHSFKSLKFCVIHECLESISQPGNEITENYHSNKTIVDNMLLSLSPSRLLAFKCLIELILKVMEYQRQNQRNNGVLPNSDMTVDKLVVLVTPYLSKPYNTAFLSIRHKELIPKVKAVLYFALQNASTLFTTEMMSRRRDDTDEGQFIAQEQSKTSNHHNYDNNSNNNSNGTNMGKSSVSGVGGGYVSGSMGGIPFTSTTTNNNIFTTPWKQPDIDGKEHAGNDGNSGSSGSSSSGSSSSGAGNGSTGGGKYPDLTIDLTTPSTLPHTPTSPRSPALHQPPQHRWEYTLLASLIHHSVRQITHPMSFQGGVEGAPPRGPAGTAGERGAVGEHAGGAMGDMSVGVDGKHRSPLTTLLYEHIQPTHPPSLNNKRGNDDNDGSSRHGGSRFTWGGGGAGVQAALKENTNTGNSHGTPSLAKRTSSSRDVTATSTSSKKSRSGDSDNNNNNRSSSSSGRRRGGGASSISRRQAVSQCRVLKEAIFGFEEGFKREHGRSPKGADRGDMQQTYDRYKEMKRTIRDAAATDIQRVVRSYGARIRVREMLRQFYSNGNDGNTSTTTRERGEYKGGEIGDDDANRMSTDDPLLRNGSVPSLKPGSVPGSVRDSNEFIPTSSAQRLANRMLADSVESLNSAASSMDSLTMDDTDNMGAVERGKEAGGDGGDGKGQGEMRVSADAEEVERRASLPTNQRRHPGAYLDTHTDRPGNRGGEDSNAGNCGDDGNGGNGGNGSNGSNGGNGGNGGNGSSNKSVSLNTSHGTMNTSHGTIFDLGVSASVDGVSGMSISGISYSHNSTLNNSTDPGHSSSASAMNATNSSGNNDNNIHNDTALSMHTDHGHNTTMSINDSNSAADPPREGGHSPRTAGHTLAGTSDGGRQRDPGGNQLMSSLELDAGLNVNMLANIKTLSSVFDTSGEAGAGNTARAALSTTLGGAVGGAEVAGLGLGPAKSGGNYSRYLLLLQSKKDLKKRLKTFDEDFLASHGRMPRKNDKEVMRPYYQSYHDLKDEIDTLKALILVETGSLPEEGPGEAGSGGEGGGLPAAPALAGLGGAGGRGGEEGAGMDMPSPGVSVSMSLPDGISMGLSGGAKPVHTGGTDPGQNGGTHQGQSDPPTHNITSSLPIENTTTDIPSSNSNTPASFPSESLPSESALGNMSLSQLNAEKKNLHSYLKTFEKQFLKEHGRPVTRQEDISPVSTEYRLYKQLKALIVERNT